MTNETKPKPRLQPVKSRFYARSALMMLGMVLLSFPFTYFAPLVTGSRHFAPVYHIHGLVFFAWIGLYAWQTHLVANGKTARHRDFGLAGIALSSLMVPLGVILAIAAAQRRLGAGNANPYDTTFYNIIDIINFSLLMIASIALVTRHIEWHRRFTFGAAICLVGPAISRWIFQPWFIRIPQISPISDFAPNIIADLFLIALLIHDRRTRGHIHPATLWMLALLVPIHLTTPFISTSIWWRGIAPSVLAFFQLSPL